MTVLQNTQKLPNIILMIISIDGTEIPDTHVFSVTEDISTQVKISITSIWERSA
jgi:hypothetical protein